MRRPRQLPPATRQLPLLAALVALILALLCPAGAAAGKRSDRDRDGLTNKRERRIGTNPRRADTDRDRLSDGREVKRYRTNPRRRDTDRDKLSDGAEVRRYKTDPLKLDTDGDGLADVVEVKVSKTNPRSADTDKDGSGDFKELLAGTDPLRYSTHATSPAAAADTSPPETTISSGPSGVVTATSATLAFVSSESGSRFDCRLDAGRWTGCSSPKTYSKVSIGTHTFSVRARDGAGNVDPTPATRSWAVAAPAVDTTPPETTITAGPSGIVTAGDASFSFTSSESSSFSCRLDAGAWGSCSSPKAYSGLAAGTHTFEVRAADGAGNIDATPASRTWTVSAPAPDPPTASYTHSPTTPTTGAPVAFDGTASSCPDTPCTYSWEDDGTDGPGGTQWPLGSGATVNFTFSGAGTKNVRLIVRDAQGRNASTAKAITVSEPAPPPDTTPPDTTIIAGPSATVSATDATFSFSSSESGSSFECKLDTGAWGACTSPKSYSGLAESSHTFSVRATDAAGNVDGTPATRTWTVSATAPPPPPPPTDFAQPSCQTGATNVTTAAAVRSAVSVGQNACVTANVGDVNLSGLTSTATRHVGTTGSGQMGHVDLGGSSRITLRARFRATTMRGSSFITIEQSIIGGTSSSRVMDQLIFMPDTNNDVIIRDNDIGWTNADNSGNTGYGVRAYGTNNRLRFERNRVHHIAADGFQGVGGSDVVIDRNEFAYVGANPGSDEHSDNIQITYNGPNLRITNNWVHHQGWYTETQQAANAGTMYVHGGSTGAMLVENNLFADSKGRVEFGGLGTGGTTRSNLTVRRNTFSNLGTAFTGFPGLEWDLNGGAANRLERNVATDPDGGVVITDPTPDHTTIANNVWGTSVPLDTLGQCTSAACNPSGQEPIGYRKPTGVHW